MFFFFKWCVMLTTWVSWKTYLNGKENYTAFCYNDYNYYDRLCIFHTSFSSMNSWDIIPTCEDVRNYANWFRSVTWTWIFSVSLSSLTLITLKSSENQTLTYYSRWGKKLLGRPFLCFFGKTSRLKMNLNSNTVRWNGEKRTKIGLPKVRWR